VENFSRRVLDEDAQARHLVDFEIAHLVIVVDLAVDSLLRRERDMEVVIEVVAEGRHPIEAPAHPPLIGLDLGEGRSGNGEQHHVAVNEVKRRAVEMICEIRATRASFTPIRSEHEVADDELAAPAEEIGQRYFAARPFEDVVLLDPDPGQLATFGAQSVTRSGQCVFVVQKLFSRCDPLVPRYDLVFHDATPSVCGAERPGG
jgi:hypothetical protein